MELGVINEQPPARKLLLNFRFVLNFRFSSFILPIPFVHDCLFSVLAYCFDISKRTRSEKDLAFIKSIDSKFESNHATLLTWCLERVFTTLGASLKQRD